MTSSGGSSYYRGRQRATVPRTPKPAQVRLDRFASTTSRTSLLTVPSAYGLRAAGLEPLGDVMGCIGSQFSHEFVGSCRSRSSGSDRTSPRIKLGEDTGPYRFSYPRLLRGVYSTALDRLRAEAVSLGADGVVGIDLTMQVHGELREVVAVGTAVHAGGRTRPARPFLTDLAGQDVAALLLAGWVPVTLHVAVQLGIRHDDMSTLNQAGVGNSRRRPNVEVTGWSELKQQTQQGAEKALRGLVTAAGADGALLSSLDTKISSRKCFADLNGSDHVACTTAVGTSIARIGGRRPAAPKILSILPVRG